jgi:hypothetical protein
METPQCWKAGPTPRSPLHCARAAGAPPCMRRDHPL